MDIRTKTLISFLGVGIFLIVIVIIIVSVSTPPEETNPINPINAQIPIDEQGQAGFGGGITGLPQNPSSEQQGTISGILTLKDFISPLNPRPDKVNTETTTVSYKVIFNATWSEITHPNFFPDGGHLSPMVTWSHSIENIVFKTGEEATGGIKLMAETGGTAPLRAEVIELGNRGFIYDFEIGKRIDAPNVQEVVLTLTENKSLVSVVSMIAPSPDWFLSAHNVRLFENGNWIDNQTVDAVLYDSGTDSGEEFNAKDLVTTPKGTIQRFVGAPSNPLGTFEFVRI